MKDKDEKLKIATDPNTPLKEEYPKRRLPWLTLSVVVLCCLVGIYLVSLLVQRSHDDNNKQVHTKTVAATHFSSPQALIDSVIPELNGQVETAVTSNGMGGKNSDGIWIYGLAPYRAAGKKFENFPADSTGTSFSSDSVTAQANFKTVADFFVNNHFDKVTATNDGRGPISDKNDQVTYDTYDVYGSDQLLCAFFEADAYATSVKNHIFGLGCADKSSYKTAADALQPFYDTYSATAQKKPASDTVLGIPALADGASGYKNVVMYQEDSNEFTSGFEGLYYMAPGKPWTLFTIAQGVPYCSAYNTDVLKSAFKGTKCYDNVAKLDSVVQ